MDQSEGARRTLVRVINADPGSREALEAEHGHNPRFYFSFQGY